MAPEADPPPNNGTRFRLEKVEQGLQRVETAQQELAGRVDRMDTYLTGAGIKGSEGKLGEIAGSMKDTAEAVKEINNNLTSTVTKVVRNEIRTARWQALASGGKGFYMLLTLLVAIAAVLVTILVHSGGKT